MGFLLHLEDSILRFLTPKTALAAMQNRLSMPKVRPAPLQGHETMLQKRFAMVRGRFAAVQRPMQWCETDLQNSKRVLQHYGSREQSKLACFAEME